MSNLKTKIGLEIHVTLNTKSKLFCTCPTTKEKPNVNICPICLGHPGSKPVTNKAAVKKIILLAKALNCKIRDELIFSRKSYFYPDLAKNYQITQFEEPVGYNGYVNLDKKIKIKRIHLEEDPASITRDKATLIDFNRSGMPLAEIVTEPDIESAKQARQFMNKLLRDLKYLEVFNDEDVLKSDVNVSIEKHNFQRVEVKNVTGFKDIESVIKYEINRQQIETPINETREWDSVNQKTNSMRKKESEADYAYIYDPDLAVTNIVEMNNSLKIPKLSDERINEYIAKGVDSTDANIIAMNKNIADFFEKTTSEPIITSQWIRRELLGTLNNQKIELAQTHITPSNFSELIQFVKNKKINEKIAKDILEKLCKENFNVTKYIKDNNLETVDDSNYIERIVNQVIAENQKAVEDYQNGEAKSLQYLVGQVMKHTKGKANPKTTNELIITKITK